MIDNSGREKLKRRIWAQQDKVSRRTIMKKEGIASEELDELYDEAIQDYRDEPPKQSMVGHHYGALEVLSIGEPYVGVNNHEAHYYLCRCKCGKTLSVKGGDLIKRRVSDCGCGSYQRKPRQVRTSPIDWSKKIEVKHYA